MIAPVAGSSPPQKLSGSDRTSASPEPSPSTRHRPSEARPERLICPYPSEQGRPYAFLRRTEEHINAEVARRVIGPLGRVRHDHAAVMSDDRRDVRARVHDDLGPGVLK